MGHTHYWSIKKPKKGIKVARQKYVDAILDCQKIIRAYSVANGGLSGFAAHTKPGRYGGLKVNGSRDLAHEDFIMRETLDLAVGSDFCKTNLKPYDMVVVACLCVLKHNLGDLIAINSDGDSPDWIKGLELARRVLNDKSIKVPETIRKRLVAL